SFYESKPDCTMSGMHTSNRDKRFYDEFQVFKTGFDALFPVMDQRFIARMDNGERTHCIFFHMLFQTVHHGVDEFLFRTDLLANDNFAIFEHQFQMDVKE